MRYLCLCLILFCACKKDKTNTVKQPLIKTRTDVGTMGLPSSVRSFSYNETGNILQDGTNLYYYAANRVIIDVDSASKVVYYLNSQGFADSAQNILKANDWVTSTSFYKYDAFGYLTDETNTSDPLFHRYRHYENGNCIWEAVTDSYIDSAAIEYEYDPTKLNTIGNENFGQRFLGLQNRNVYKRTKFVYPPAYANYKYTYTYHYNNIGRVDTEYIANLATEIGIIAYTYY